MNHKTFAVFIALTLTSSSAVVRAQTEAPGASTAELGEVVVTATRREESVEKVPISIAALDQQALTQDRVENIGDLAAIVPGLQFSANGDAFLSNNTSISIRGFNSMAGASTVGIYLDDAPLQGRMSPIGNVGYIFPLIFDLDRVEVLRGPQGTLFGASSESGAIRFITNQPSLTQFSGFSHAEYSSTQDGAPSYEIGAAYGGPIVNDELGFRVSAWARENGGYVDRSSPSGDVFSTDSNSDRKAVIRMALGVKAGEVLITPAITYQSIDVHNGNSFFDLFSNPSQGYFVNARLFPDSSTEHVIIPSVKAEAPFGFADLTAVATYVSRRFTENTDVSPLVCAVFGGCGSPLGFAYPSSTADASSLGTGQKFEAISGEVRLASSQPDAFATWVAGLYVDHRKQNDYSTLIGPDFFAVPTGGNPLLYANQFIWDDQYAVFAQSDLHVAPKLTLTLGGREELATSKQLNFNAQGAFDAGAPPKSSGSTRETAFLPKATLSYQFTPENLLYASAGKGLRVGGSNNGLPTFCNLAAAPNYNPDSLWSYELGTKDRFLNGRLQLDASAYHVRISNIQSIVFLACSEGYVGNLGTAVNDGFDLSLQALITDQLRVDLNVGYSDLRYVDTTYSANGTPVSVKGDAVEALGYVNPPWDVSVSPNYTFPLAEGDKVRLRVQYIFHSRNNRSVITENPDSPSYSPAEVPDPPTHLTNFRATYIRGAFEGGAYLENAFNSHPLLGAYQDVPTSNLITHSTFRPRTFGISLNYTF
jgi:outer membrane receptor protein involved in Fe transport